MYEEILSKAGLSPREIAIYTILRTQGELLASEISRKSQIIRTNTYDILGSLVKKGVCAYAVRNGKKYFRAAHPAKLIDYIDQRKDDLEDIKQEISAIIPSLEPISFNVLRPSIEIYEGKEGFKTILEMSIRESLKTGLEILGISVQQQKCRDLGVHYHVRWYTQREKLKLPARYLM